MDASRRRVAGYAEVGGGGVMGETETAAVVLTVSP